MVGSHGAAAAGAATEVRPVWIHRPEAVDGCGREAAVLVRGALPQVDGQNTKYQLEEDHQLQDLNDRTQGLHDGVEQFLHAGDGVEVAQRLEEPDGAQHRPVAADRQHRGADHHEVQVVEGVAQVGVGLDHEAHRDDLDYCLEEEDPGEPAVQLVVEHVAQLRVVQRVNLVHE